jgi:hypothetical protein
MRSRIIAVCTSIGFFAAASALADDAAPAAGAAAPATDTAAAPATPPPTKDSAAPAAADRGTGGEKEREANNAVYLEGLGAGLLYSVNYERAFGDFSARVGFSYLGVSASASNASNTAGSSASASFITVPITVSYLGIGSVRNIFEVGAGATIMNMGAGASVFGDGNKASGSASLTIVRPTVLAGYRYQPEDGGFFFKVGMSGIVDFGLPVLPLPYLSLGGTFGP